MNYLYMLVAPNGAVLVDDTNPHTDPGIGIKIRENTVIGAWTDQDGIDLVARFGLAGKLLTSADPALMVPSGKKSGSITLASGSIWILL